MNKLNNFIKLFVSLGFKDKNLQNTKIENIIELTLNQFHHDDINNLIQKIGKELGRQNNSKAYVLSILRRFQYISPYLLINIEKKKSNYLGKNTIIIGNTTYDEGCYFCHKTLEHNCGWEEPLLDYNTATTYEKYIIECFTYFNFFFYQFDKLCLNYGIDIINIQEENGITIWIRDLHNLITEGYGNKIKQIKSTLNVNTEQSLSALEPLRIEVNQSDDINNIHPKHNPNLWNLDCYDLFKYLFDNYYNGQKRKLTNIWFYLNEYRDSKYTLKSTKDEFKVFIQKTYNVEIKNFDKAHAKYSDKEYPTMNEHRQNFEDNLK